MRSEPQAMVIAFPWGHKPQLVFLGQKKVEDPRSLTFSAKLVLDGENVREAALRCLLEKWGVTTRPSDLRLAVLVEVFFGAELRYQCHIFLAKHCQFVKGLDAKMNHDHWYQLGLLPADVWPSKHPWFLAVPPRSCLSAKAHHNSDGSELIGFSLQAR